MDIYVKFTTYLPNGPYMTNCATPVIPVWYVCVYKIVITHGSDRQVLHLDVFTYNGYVTYTCVKDVVLRMLYMRMLYIFTVYIKYVY